MKHTDFSKSARRPVNTYTRIGAKVKDAFMAVDKGSLKGRDWEEAYRLFQEMFSIKITTVVPGCTVGGTEMPNTLYDEVMRRVRREFPKVTPKANAKDHSGNHGFEYHLGALLHGYRGLPTDIWIFAANGGNYQLANAKIADPEFPLTSADQCRGYKVYVFYSNGNYDMVDLQDYTDEILDPAAKIAI